MTDLELLELAKKAAGFPDGWVAINWNPLQDDGDALRLAVRFDIDVEQNTAFKRACALWWGDGVLQTEVFESWGNDKCAATRRAITRAAAQKQLAKEQRTGDF